jgi:hypothetical protein
MDHVVSAAQAMANRLAARTGDMVALIRDLVVTIFNRAPLGDSGGQEAAAELVFRTLHIIIERAAELTDITDVSETPDGEEQVVTEEIARRGLGTCGRVEIPPEMWTKYAPPNWDQVLWEAHTQRSSKDRRLLALAEALVRDGMALECPKDPELRPNARGFVLWKNNLKASFIADMTDLNKACELPQFKFKLPSLELLASMLRKTGGEMRSSLWMTKLDVSNHFWTCRMPAKYANSVRIGVCGKVFALPSLPFGWTHSPVMAQRLLGETLAKMYPNDVIIIQYVDDILVFGLGKDRVGDATQLLIRLMEEDNWVVSPKSVTEPTQKMSWMGKELDIVQGSIAATPMSVAGVILLFARLASKGYRKNWIERLIGKIHWLARPAKGGLSFLAGPTAWKTWGPEKSAYTPPKVLSALMESIAFAIHPWMPDPEVTKKEVARSGEGTRLGGATPRDGQWYVDAAKMRGGAYYAGLWGEVVGTRVWRAPAWVRSQQQGELFGLEMGIKLAAHRGLKKVHIVGDNVGTLFQALKGRAGIGFRVQNRILRRITHTLRWSKLRLGLSWVGSKDNPADPVSRFFEFPTWTEAWLKAWMVGVHTDYYRDRTVWMGGRTYRG